MKYLITLSALLCFSIVSAQVLTENRQKIDPNRFGDIKGLPYHFENHVQAIINFKNEEDPFEVTLNVNLYKPLVEIFFDDYFLQIEFTKVSSIAFPNLGIFAVPYRNQMIFHIYDGEKYKLTNTPWVKLETITHRPPGSIITKERFVKKDYYTISDGEEGKEISLNKRSISKILGKEAAQLAKKNKNKLKTQEDLIQLLKYLEQKNTNG
ncbi:MAG: hypothetical protein ACI9FN_003746 [Saprospiraceae bacterium]|jgi:hypothetical protein